MGSGKIDTSLLNVVGVGGVGGVVVGGGISVGGNGISVGGNGVGVGGIILITFRESIAPAVPLIVASPCTKGIGGFLSPPPWRITTDPG